MPAQILRRRLSFTRDRQRLGHRRMRLGLGEGLRRGGSRGRRRNRFVDRGRHLRIVGRNGRLVDVADLHRVADVFLQRGHDVGGGKTRRDVLDLIEAFLEVGHFGLAHGFLELALEFGGHLARLAHPLTDHAQHARQLFRADGNQRDNRDDDQFTPPDVEHEFFRSRETSAPQSIIAKIWSCPRLFSTGVL